MPVNGYISVPEKEAALKRLKELQTASHEHSQKEADEILCSLLDKLGFKDVADEWKKVPKFYA